MRENFVATEMAVFEFGRDAVADETGVLLAFFGKRLPRISAIKKKSLSKRSSKKAQKLIVGRFSLNRNFSTDY